MVQIAQWHSLKMIINEIKARPYFSQLKIFCCKAYKSLCQKYQQKQINSAGITIA